MFKTIRRTKTTHPARTYSRFTCRTMKISGINYKSSIYSSGAPRSRVTLITLNWWTLPPSTWLMAIQSSFKLTFFKTVSNTCNTLLYPFQQTLHTESCQQRYSEALYTRYLTSCDRRDRTNHPLQTLVISISFCTFILVINSPQGSDNA